MSRIRTNLITNRMANGAPTVSHGLVISGVTTVTGSINNLNLTGITTSIQHQATNINVTGVVTATTFSGSGASLTNLNGSNIASGTVPVARIGTGTKSTSTFYRGDGTFATVTSTTINNNADNRVITGSGSANTLEGEANFTYNSDVATLTRSGNDNASGLVIANSNNSQGSAIAQVEIQGGDNASGRLKLECSGQNHTLIEDSTGNLSIEDNGTERLRIASSYARIGINTTTFDTAGSQIKIEGRGAGTTSPAYLQIKGVGSGVVHAYVDLIATSANNAGSAYRGLGVVMLDEPTNVEWFSGRPYAGSDEYIISRKASPSYRTQSGEKANALFKVGSDGKLYKGGDQFYPLVNYSTYATFSAVSVSSNSYTDLRTILSSYTPKKAGNLIVIHHQSQCWQGSSATGNGDAMWKIQKQEGGGSWSDVIANERIMGNMDGRNYTGDSGLARHHRTVHLMGSFECAGTSINLKTQGKVDFTSVGLQWYHNNENILQIWEYEKG